MCMLLACTSPAVADWLFGMVIVLGDPGSTLAIMAALDGGGGAQVLGCEGTTHC